MIRYVSMLKSHALHVLEQFQIFTWGDTCALDPGVNRRYMRVRSLLNYDTLCWIFGCLSASRVCIGDLRHDPRHGTENMVRDSERMWAGNT